MVGIVNKVYSESNLVPRALFPGSALEVGTFKAREKRPGDEVVLRVRRKSFVSGRAWGNLVPAPPIF